MPYDVSQYIVDRISALGVDRLFHVPGNYCAEFLLRAESANDLQCVNVTNEMEGGYAADGYARFKGLGVVCVTYGVGTGSLLNAIEGAYVEFCPVLLLNGSPMAHKVQQLVDQGVKFAHAIDPVRTDERIFEPVTAATAVITSAADAPREIDRVLRTCLTERRPVYLEVRHGVWSEECEPPADRTERLLPFPYPPEEQKDIDTATASAAAAVVARLEQAKSPVLWGGAMIDRWGLNREFEELIKTLDIVWTTTLLGKSIVSEELPNFGLVYDSSFAPEKVRTTIENTDCLLAVGTIMGDFYGNIVARSYDDMILAAGGAVRIGNDLYPHAPLDQFLPELIRQLKEKDAQASYKPPAGYEAVKEVRDSRRKIYGQGANAAFGALESVNQDEDTADQATTWDNFFLTLQSALEEDMIVLADTSLCLFPAADLTMKQPRSFVAQSVWLSIGYMTGAAVGVCAAEPGRRTVALIGDGGFQMIPSAFSTLCRMKHKKPPLMIVFDNGLYAVEQFLVVSENKAAPDYYFGDKKPYFFNELAQWDYVKLAEAYGGRGFSVGNLGELRTALESALAADNTTPTLLAVKLDQRDLPQEIRKFVEATPAASGHEAAFATGAAPRPTISLPALN